MSARETLLLYPDRPLRLDAARHAELCVESGMVWITASGVAGDLFLAAGERYRVQAALDSGPARKLPRHAAERPGDALIAVPPAPQASASDTPASAASPALTFSAWDSAWGSTQSA